MEVKTLLKYMDPKRKYHTFQHIMDMFMVAR